MLRQIAQKRRTELKNQRSATDGRQDARRKAQATKLTAIFNALFADLIPDIRKEGIEIGIRPNPYLNFAGYVVFSKNGREWRLEITKSGTWRYRPDQNFGQWPKEDLAVALVDHLLS